MTIARAHLVDPAVTRWYHCLTRCVRRAILLGEGPDGRKLWIERRLRELAEIFGVPAGAFSVLDDHRHVLVRLDAEAAQGWSEPPSRSDRALAVDHGPSGHGPTVRAERQLRCVRGRWEACAGFPDRRKPIQQKPGPETTGGCRR